QTLPPQTGIIAVTDARARHVLQACEHLHIPVPEKLCVIGIDNFPRIEVELAFVLAKPLRGPHCTLFDVYNATDYVIPALELIDAR
ncbi:substrate-binding domain-containing protein, partial [Salmonella enterica subsp. enterica serovar Kentucky]|nr:substrate-binding domain-containing protein [Salmonella enterica subsp. enterica serovar Kentucky]